jgi:hypothetical protein
MSDLFKVLRSTVKAGAKFQALVRSEYERGDEGAQSILSCAAAIEAAYPVSKVEGKDTNRTERNGYLTALRMALSRTGKEQSTPRRITIKKVEGEWTLLDEAVAAKTPEEPGAGEGGDEAPAMPASMEQQQEALWQAVELVTANLHNKAVRIALQDALAGLLKKAA